MAASTLSGIAPADVSRLVASLASNDPQSRAAARQRLARQGSPEVIAALVAELSDPRDHVRWEAAKALVDLAEPVTAPAFLEALDDQNADVRWVAAQGLIALGTVGLLTVLHGLTKKSRSIPFCQSAHHVLHDLARRHDAEILAPVLAALEQGEPAVSVPPVAYHALMRLKTGLG